MGLGRITLTAGYNYNKTDDHRSRAALPTLPGLILFARPESLRLTDGQPRSKINLGARLELRAGRPHRAHQPLRPGADPGHHRRHHRPDRRLADRHHRSSPKWITDAELRVRPFGEGSGFELAVGANNLFDVYPDRLARPAASSASTTSSWPYSSFSPFGFNGRFVYGRVSFEF